MASIGVPAVPALHMAERKDGGALGSEVAAATKEEHQATRILFVFVVIFSYGGGGDAPYHAICYLSPAE